MAFSDLDATRLREALALAESSFGLTEPNPRVGCIVGWADGRIGGRGATQHAGGSHAEVMALAEAGRAGADLAGATAWVTLEPCAHHGRTPPCCDALIRAGLARVVVAVADPFPAVAGEGLARLRAAGVAVEVAPPEFARAAIEVNIGFFSRVTRGRPWFRIKAAMSLDGRTALPDGRSQWITGTEARADGHAWRRRASAVLTGIGTVLADDPRLDVRLVATPAQPLRVVVDSRGRLPPGARLLQPPGTVRVYGATRGDEPGIDRVVLPGRDGRVDLNAMAADLAAIGVNEVHVEAGAVLNGALSDAGLADEWLLYIAPRLLGSGPGVADAAVPSSLSTVPECVWHDVVPLAADLRARARSRAAEAWIDGLRDVGGLYNPSPREGGVDRATF